MEAQLHEAEEDLHAARLRLHQCEEEREKISAKVKEMQKEFAARTGEGETCLFFQVFVFFQEKRKHFVTALSKLEGRWLKRWGFWRVWRRRRSDGRGNVIELPLKRVRSTPGNFQVVVGENFTRTF